ncbi:alpha/beta fold hydrolase [Aurantiacibacter aquimixticola]|uniref:Alpha/beta hydrolase n=1 Tax=Aurantiacibacter aquimixticola TaxID=1958945 RepID=A0A419RQF2_9SPHN|nr:alpha/beta hydrolase [Aurantiacibacter aquimixticola]RJY08023.1 alpha/beta hydrolase [Aurantiacibacter aquimixticola]
MGDQAYRDGSWQSGDGLTLHFRDYPGRDDRPLILCIPGLTRNVRDFEPVAEAFAGEWRIICVDLRGRGKSDYAKDAASYTPAQYVQDIAALFEQEKLERVVAVGTSLGGIVSMLWAAQTPERFAGVVLNDIGPTIEEEGLARIRDYVGQGRSFPTWMHAARALRETNLLAYPDYATQDWLRLAKRLMVVGGSGRITFDYDMRIAEPFSDPPAEPFDMWPVYAKLDDTPVLALRGELSDILSHETLARMERELPNVDAVTVPRVGHAPTLEEPEAQAAIARLLGKVA